MKIVVLSGGLRGDILPYAALAIGFAQAGHQVRFATMREFEYLVEGHDVETWCGDIDTRQLLQSDTAQDMFDSGTKLQRRSVKLM